jgi:hypothetical protein
MKLMFCSNCSLIQNLKIDKDAIITEINKLSHRKLNISFKHLKKTQNLKTNYRGFAHLSENLLSYNISKTPSSINIEDQKLRPIISQKDYETLKLLSKPFALNPQLANRNICKVFGEGVVEFTNSLSLLNNKGKTIEFHLSSFSELDKSGQTALQLLDVEDCITSNISDTNTLCITSSINLKESKDFKMVRVNRNMCKLKLNMTKYLDATKILQLDKIIKQMSELKVDEVENKMLQEIKSGYSNISTVIVDNINKKTEDLDSLVMFCLKCIEDPKLEMLKNQLEENVTNKDIINTLGMSLSLPRKWGKPIKEKIGPQQRLILQNKKLRDEFSVISNELPDRLISGRSKINSTTFNLIKNTTSLIRTNKSYQRNNNLIATTEILRSITMDLIVDDKSDDPLNNDLLLFINELLGVVSEINLNVNKESSRPPFDPNPF